MKKIHLFVAVLSISQCGYAQWAAKPNGTITISTIVVVNTFQTNVQLTEHLSIAKPNPAFDDVFELISNEVYASIPCKLSIYINGNSALIPKGYILQTSDHNLANDSNILLQQYGGNIGAASYSPISAFQADDSYALGLQGDASPLSVNFGIVPIVLLQQKRHLQVHYMKMRFTSIGMSQWSKYGISSKLT